MLVIVGNGLSFHAFVVSFENGSGHIALIIVGAAIGRPYAQNRRKVFTTENLDIVFLR